MPAFTVGSLRRRTQMEGLLEFVHFLIQQDNAGEKLKELCFLCGLSAQDEEGGNGRTADSESDFGLIPPRRTVGPPAPNLRKASSPQRKPP